MKKTASMIIKPSEESRELALYAENTAPLYHSRIVPVVRCLAKHLKRGQFDRDRAISAFYPVAGAWCADKSAHRAVIHYTDHDSYFMYRGNRIKFSECLRA